MIQQRVLRPHPGEDARFRERATVQQRQVVKKRTERRLRRLPRAVFASIWGRICPKKSAIVA